MYTLARLNDTERQFIAETIDALMLPGGVGFSFLGGWEELDPERTPLLLLELLALVVNEVHVLAQERDVTPWETWLRVRRFIMVDAAKTTEDTARGDA